MTEKLTREEREAELRAPEPRSKAASVAKVAWIVGTCVIAVALFCTLPHRKLRHVKYTGYFVLASMLVYRWAVHRNVLGDRSFD